MKSHHYALNKNSVIGLIAGPLLIVAALGLMMRLLAYFSLIPTPRPALDVDRAVIVHQIDAANVVSNADIVLFGDSSCLMNVDAALLQTLTQSNVINLGLLSFLDLQSFADLLARYLSQQTDPPSQIIFLTHPDFVRKSAASSAHLQAYQAYVNQADDSFSGGSPWDPRRVVGTHLVEGRLLSRLPTPLPGAFGRRFGFTTDLMDFMTEHRGSAIDPRVLNADALSGSSDYRVARFHSRQAPSLTRIIPPSSRLLIGLSPMPESFPDPNFASEYQRLLREWSNHFPNSIPLDQLPSTLGDEQFATKTHLSATAAQEYTKTLFQQLSPRHQ